MKRSFLNSTGPAALLAAFLLGVFLPAVARAQAQDNCSASPQVTVQALQVTAQASQDERDRQEWLMIMAFTHAPVVGADVRVTANGWVLVDAKAATNRQGEFPARIWRAWLPGEEAAGDANVPEAERRRSRSLVRISISGGTVDGNPFLGHLTADIALTDPAHQILVVNAVTTLVSLVRDARPELKLDKAEALVRRFLKLPTNYSLGLALRQGPHYVSPFFSPGVFLKEAQAAGGLDALAHLLLQELASGSTHPFRPSQLLGSTGSSDAAQLLGSIPNPPLPSISVIQAGLYAGILDWAGSENVYSTAGWALALVGMDTTTDTTQADVDAVASALIDLQSSIFNLSSQVAQLTALVQATATLNLYNTIVVPAQSLASTVCGVENDLAYWAGVCTPKYVGQTKPNPEPYCTSEKASINTELNESTIQQAYGNMEGYVNDNPTTGFRGMLHLYSLWLGQSKQFFRPADSTAMKNLYDYWDDALTQTANLKIELLHENDAQDGNPAQLTDFMGNPNATPPSIGTFQKNQNANLSLMWPPVPVDPPTRGATVISTRDHTMWALVPWAQIGTDANGGPLYQPLPRCWLGSGALTYGSKTPYAGFSDWSWGSKPQWQAAVSLAPTDGSVHWWDWVMQQTQTTGEETPPSPGFFDTPRACSGQGYPATGGVWTSTGAYATFWYMDPINNSFQNLSGNLNGKDTSGFFFPARTLAPGEQYFWYQ